MSRPRQEKSFQEKLKSFFKVGVTKESIVLPPNTEYVIPDAVLAELDSDQDVSVRVRSMQELTQIVKLQRLQGHAVELLWVKVQDLAKGCEQNDARRECWNFLEAIIRGQFDHLDIMRAEFFRLIKTGSGVECTETLTQRIQMLDALTQRGEKILHFEDEIGPLTQKLWPLILTTGSQNILATFLQINNNLLKYNSSYVDTDVLVSLIVAYSNICGNGRPDDVKLCLSCLDAIICYNHIPKEGLFTFICLISRVVNQEQHCTEAWKIAKHLMGTHLGHSALYCLCQILQTPDFKRDVALIRGAVFFIGMALWGSQRVKNLDTYSAMTIMPTFRSALDCNHQLVLFEVLLQTERMVTKHSSKMKAPGYDAVVGLLEKIIHMMPDVIKTDKLKPEILSHLSNIVTFFEKLSIADRYTGSKHKLFDLIDLCSDHRPEDSVISLIKYRINDIYTTKPGWMGTISELLKKYFIKDSRPAVRCTALHSLLQVYKSNKQIHEEEILKTLILPFVSRLDEEVNLIVKLEAISMITDICKECSSKKTIDLLDILEKIISKPIEQKKIMNGDLSSRTKWSDNEFIDIHKAVEGLISIFCARVCQHPASITIRTYHIIVKHLEMAYNNLDVFGHCGYTRKIIFQLFMKLRANGKFHLGVEEERGAAVHFSPYLICRSPMKEPSSNPSGLIGKNVAYISLSKACMMVIKCLCNERDFNVLTLVLDDVPLVLCNKAVFLLYGNNIKDFVNPLIGLTDSSLKYPDILSNLPICKDTGKKYSRGDFVNKVYSVLAAIAPYSEYLEGSQTSFSQSKVTNNMVLTLVQGLTIKESSRTCILALTTCSLEMPKTMYKNIDKVLLSFSKISATKHVATPMLEFLSTLIRLPEVFCSFIDKTYFTVFAIALPFTNPFKFDAYTVSLAHHVLIMWFLKCRLAFRQSFVSFIINGLKNNIMKSFEEGGFRRGSIAPSQQISGRIRNKTGGGGTGSDMRLRSNSLSEHSPEKSKMRHPTAAPATSSNLQPLSGSEEEKMEKMMTFHEELTYTCVDILATYMFANVAVKPKRMPTASFLLKNGQTASWIIGTKVVTITTSICDQTSTRGPLCDRCHLLCSRAKSIEEQMTTEASSGGRHKSSETIPVNSEEESSRRRHQSDAVVGSPTKSALPNMLPLTSNYRRGSTTSNSSDRGSEASTNMAANKEDWSKLESLLESREKSEKKQELCSCWCNGWAEIHVRRPSGEVSWITRIQNASLTSESHAEFPLSDLTTLFHPDKEDHEDLQQLSELGSDNAAETFSVFSRGRHASESSTSAPASPVKEMKQPDFPLSPNAGAVDSTCVSPKTKSPTTCKTPTPALDKESNLKQSCDPIPEVDDEEDRQHDPLRRRTSLQSSSGQELNILKREKSMILATPPRTPVPRDPQKTVLNRSNRAEALQIGSYGSAGSQMRDRAHTISGPSPRRSATTPQRGPYPAGASNAATGTAPSNSVSSSGSFSSKYLEQQQQSQKLERVTGISPQMVFLTLYHSQCFGNMPESEKPMLINTSNKSIESSLKILNRIYPHETHKVGVLYVGAGQASDEIGILANSFGSLRYADFLHGLGSLICLRDVDPQTTFVGGLHAEDGDGDYAYMWEDDVMQVIFHVATLMPNHPETDPKCNKKKRHIGNDYVAIVYNNAGDNKEYKLGTVKGQFIYACVIITPLDQGSNRVEIQCRPELAEPLEHIKDAKIVSDRNLAVQVRQMALHCNLAAHIQRSVSAGKEPYASNWLERLRAIKRIREKVIKERDNQDKNDSNKNAANDFTEAVLQSRK